MTQQQQPGPDGPNRIDERVGDWIAGDSTAVGDAYKRFRAWSRTGVGSAITAIALLVFYLAFTHFFSSSNKEGYANLRGLALVSDGKYDEAIVEYNKSIKLAPGWYQPYMGRGNAYRLKHDYGQALADLNKSIELKSDYAESHYDRGLVWRGKGDNARAMADFSRAIDLDPTGAVGAIAAVERAKIYRENKAFELALADLTRAITQHSETGWLLDRARLNFFDLNRPPQAADDFAAAARQAIKYRDWANLLNSGLKENERPRTSGDMMDTNVPFNPGGYYALLWAHYARVHAGEDDRKEMDDLIGDLIGPDAKDVFLRNLPQPDAAIVARALKPWPGAIYLMFLGKITPEAVRAQVQEAPDAAIRRRRQCDVDFYLAIFHLQKRADADARLLLQAAVTGCPPESLEAQFAKVEFNRRRL